MTQASGSRRSDGLRATAWIAVTGFSLACGAADAPGTARTDDVGASLLSVVDRTTARVPVDSTMTQASQASSATPGPLMQPPETPIPVIMLGHDTGTPNSPVRVIEFSDFACGYCRQFHMESYPTLEREYMATGKVEWKYVPMILGMFGPNADAAAEAGECAQEQNLFPQMRDKLFADQAMWKRARDPMPELRKVAESVGMDMMLWGSCMAEGRMKDRIRAGTQLAFESGLRGTPTFIIVGYQPIPGAIPLDVFKSVLDGVYERAINPN